MGSAVGVSSGVGAGDAVGSAVGVGEGEGVGSMVGTGSAVGLADGAAVAELAGAGVFVADWQEASGSASAKSAAQMAISGALRLFMILFPSGGPGKLLPLYHFSAKMGL